MRKVILFFLLLSICSTHAQTNTVRYAHAHNDYTHKRPLFTALENGFSSIEVDVFLHRGQLRVAHLPIALGSRKTLTELYLLPLATYLDTSTTFLPQPIILMIDFKTKARPTYEQLKKEILPFKKYLTGYTKYGAFQDGKIQLLISGSAPTGEVLSEDTTYVRIDGNVQSMSDTTAHSVIGRFSSNWHSYFTWRGRKELPKEEKTLLDTLVSTAHKFRKDIRFYHLPDRPNVWRTLLEAGVDWINTDKLVQFRRFYLDDYRR